MKITYLKIIRQGMQMIMKSKSCVLILICYIIERVWKV